MNADDYIERRWCPYCFELDARGFVVWRNRRPVHVTFTARNSFSRHGWWPK